MSKHVTPGIYWEPDRWLEERRSWNSHQTSLDKLVTPGGRPQPNIMKKQRERFRRKKSKILEEGASLHCVRILWRQVGERESGGRKQLIVGRTIKDEKEEVAFCMSSPNQTSCVCVCVCVCVWGDCHWSHEVLAFRTASDMNSLLQGGPDEGTPISCLSDVAYFHTARQIWKIFVVQTLRASELMSDK
jgi:hypothetical protein